MTTTTGRRRKRERNFVLIENSMFEDNRLSWKAKELLGYLLTKPDGWTVRIPDLVKHATDGEKAIRSAIKELKTYGYLTFHKTKDQRGKWSGTVWEYDDIPMFDVEDEKEEEKADEKPKTQEPQGIAPHADFRHVENRHAENGTHISNTDFSNKDFNNISSSRDSIDQELREKYQDKPFDEIRAELLADETAVIETDKQYRAVLEYRLSRWTPKQQKKPNARRKTTRKEPVPKWLNGTDQPNETSEDFEGRKRKLEERLKKYKK